MINNYSQYKPFKLTKKKKKSLLSYNKGNGSLHIYPPIQDKKIDERIKGVFNCCIQLHSSSTIFFYTAQDFYKNSVAQVQESLNHNFPSSIHIKFK